MSTLRWASTLSKRRAARANTATRPTTATTRPAACSWRASRCRRCRPRRRPSSPPRTLPKAPPTLSSDSLWVTYPSRADWRLVRRQSCCSRPVHDSSCSVSRRPPHAQSSDGGRSSTLLSTALCLVACMYPVWAGARISMAVPGSKVRSYARLLGPRCPSPASLRTENLGEWAGGPSHTHSPPLLPYFDDNLRFTDSLHHLLPPAPEFFRARYLRS
mmetsp:Transcript_32487/g.62575  ORF Transcript_32487/g.62575 Transcript_32487/m.62575 type:complete len:216 (+) Transcript_32487:595-1242(+)